MTMAILHRYVKPGSGGYLTIALIKWFQLVGYAGSIILKKRKCVIQIRQGLIYFVKGRGVTDVFAV